MRIKVREVVIHLVHLLRKPISWGTRVARRVFAFRPFGRNRKGMRSVEIRAKFDTSSGLGAGGASDKGWVADLLYRPSFSVIGAQIVRVLWVGFID